MAKNTQPIAKRCKALGISPAVLGYAKKNTTRNSNGNMRKKQSEYAMQLKEKQKVKFIYGVLEKQFRNTFEKAAARPGQTGENLLQMMECRLDNVVFRLGYAQTRRDARQLVSHAPLHRQRQEGQHPLLPGEGRRRGGSARGPAALRPSLPSSPAPRPPSWLCLPGWSARPAP